MAIIYRLTAFSGVIWILFFTGSVEMMPLFAQETTKPVELTAVDNGRSIRVIVGQEIRIHLNGNPSTGYSWVNETRGRVVQLKNGVGQKCNMIPWKDAAKNTRGSNAEFTAVFAGISPGNDRIVLSYKRVWQKKDADRAVIIDVIVK